MVDTKPNGRDTAGPPEQILKAMESRPEKVCILGLGPSHRSYNDAICRQACNVPWDEVWTVNYGGAIYHCDKVFDMHDLAEQEKEGDRAAYVETLKHLRVPLVTTKRYDAFPASVDYPIHEVSESVGTKWFRNTVVYMVAYAMYIQAKEIYFFGCDFHYPDKHTAEEGAQNVAYLLGIARERGINFLVPNTSTLIGANWGIPDGNGKMAPLAYGYKEQPFVSKKLMKDFREGKAPIDYSVIPEWVLRKELKDGALFTGS